MFLNLKHKLKLKLNCNINVSFNNGPVYMRWMYPSVQGTRTNAASRHSRRKIGTNGNPDEYPSLVSDFGLNHTRKATGTYVNEAAPTKHKELQDALKSSQDSGENVPKKEVMKKVLDKTPVVDKEDEEYEESYLSS
uniref:Uncharacterized protein n=1 Tax=Tanacetum cinerariifolium TaxID=118510 RepID=A0A6L2KNK9_TANCI|nr:hypothetical protein [Tanacetum cinerariifolium]